MKIKIVPAFSVNYNKMARKIFDFPASDTRLCLVEFYTLFKIQYKVSLEIKKKRGSSIDHLLTHHS